jgi:hypothetical protein
MKPVEEDQLVTGLVAGIEVGGGLVLYAFRVAKGRFPEEVNMVLNVRAADREVPLMSLKYFRGREPYYPPWVELYGIRDEISLGEGEPIRYYCSPLEDNLLHHLASKLTARSRLFVEYVEDEETRLQLAFGCPPPVTRLGYKLFKLGYTWFKDWYFPEGFMEGGPKLQAERPLDSETRRVQLEALQQEVAAYIRNMSLTPSPSPKLVATLRRAIELLGTTISSS